MNNSEVKKLPNSQIEISVEIPADDFERAYQATLSEYQRTSIPGFRPGHIPEHILTEKIGASVILQKAAQKAIEHWYEDCITRESFEPIGRPDITITKIARRNPLGIKLITSIMPSITLPDYKTIAKEIFAGLEAEYAHITVEEKEIDDTIEYLRNSKRKAQSAKPNENEQKEIPLDDEFAKSVGNFKTLQELREVIRANTKLEKEMKKKEEKRMAVLEEIAKKITIDIPDIMISSEKEKMMGELRSSIEHMGMKWDDYLTHVKKTEEEIKTGWDDQARKRVMFGLILRAIAKQENIAPADADVGAYAETLKKQYADGKGVDGEHLRHYAYGVLKNEKIFQFLEGKSM